MSTPFDARQPTIGLQKGLSFFPATFPKHHPTPKLASHTQSHTVNISPLTCPLIKAFVYTPSLFHSIFLNVGYLSNLLPAATKSQLYRQSHRHYFLLGNFRPSPRTHAAKMTRKKGQGTDKSVRFSSAGQCVNELPSWWLMDCPMQTTTAQDSGSPTTPSSKAPLSPSSGYSSYGAYWHNSHTKCWSLNGTS